MRITSESIICPPPSPPPLWIYLTMNESKPWALGVKRSLSPYLKQAENMWLRAKKVEKAVNSRPRVVLSPCLAGFLL